MVILCTLSFIENAREELDDEGAALVARAQAPQKVM